MLFDSLVPEWVVPKEIRGDDKTCLVCQLGKPLMELVEFELRKGSKPNDILRKVKHKFPKEYRCVRTLRKFDLFYHQSHSEITAEQRREAVRRRKELMKKKKSVEEINDAVLTNIAKAIDLVAEIKPDELSKLSPKEKFELFEKAAKLLQGEKKIQLEARKQAKEEAEWLNELNSLNTPTKELPSGN